MNTEETTSTSELARIAVHMERMIEHMEEISEALNSLEYRIEGIEMRTDGISEDIDHASHYSLTGFEAVNGRLDFIDDQFDRLESRLASSY